MEFVEEDADELVTGKKGRDEEDGLDPDVKVWVSEAAGGDWRVESCVGNAEVVGVTIVVVRVEDVVRSSSVVKEGPSIAEDKPIVCDEGIGVTSVGVEEVEGKPWDSEDVE